MNPLLLAVFGGAIAYGVFALSGFQHDAERQLGAALSGPDKKISLTVNMGFESLSGVIPSAWVRASDFSVDGSPFHCQTPHGRQGGLRRLELRLTHFHLHGLPVDSMNATIRGLRYDLGVAVHDHRIAITQGGQGQCVVKVSNNALLGFAETKLPFLKGAQVTMDGDHLLAQGSMASQGRDVLFQADGTIQIVDGVKLIVVDPHVSIDSKPLSGGAAKLLVAGLNPLLDLNRDLHLDSSVLMSSITDTAGVCTITGTATIPPKALPDPLPGNH